jgi:DNA-binding transcriptional MerR regulator
MPDHSRVKTELPPIPAKRYFTIGEVSDLCAVKPHVLRYWEQEFAQLKPVKRRGNRRYYQHHEVLLIRRIRDLLYEQGFTINGARHRLESETASQTHAATESGWLDARKHDARPMNVEIRPNSGWTNANLPDPVEIRQELEEIRQLLGYDS